MQAQTPMLARAEHRGHAITGPRATAERVFTVADVRLGLSWPTDQSGVVVIVDAAARWFTARAPEVEAAAAACWPRVTAVTVVTPGAEPARVTLAAVFAAHLATARRERPDLGKVFITSPDRPTPPRGWVRLAHLVTVAAAPDPVDDLVWEILPHEHARRWIGRRLPRSGFIEAHLPALVRLRQAVRCGRLADTPTGRALAEALDGRDLSTTFVYHHTRLVWRALRELARAEHRTRTARTRISAAGSVSTGGAVHP